MPTITTYSLHIHGHYFRASQQNITFFIPVDHFTKADEKKSTHYVFKPREVFLTMLRTANIIAIVSVVD